MNEAALTAGLRAVDEQVFETLVRTYGGRLLAVARRMLHEEEDARDAVQEAFINAFRSRHTFKGDAQISTWLHSIVVNVALMKLRTRRRKPEESIQDFLPRFLPDEHHAEHFPSWTEPVDVALSRKETADMVRKAIEALPETYRTVVLLRDIEGLSTEETATLVDTTPNAVKIRLHRGRLALRTLIAPHLAGAHA
ncbi:MAG: sigma-70 family RNA polymerase sigma factor [Acidimicrobiia bacterium]|nr:sigma-70 family RNA polymerase sigma factor [Acidimicrobiia bacterium]